MRIALLGLIAGIWVTHSALAEDTQAKPNCYEIVSPTQASQPSQILLNRCSGASWLLVRTASAEPAGRAPETFTYRWFPLSSGTGDPVLASPGTLAPAQQTPGKSPR